jgi:hypothetical protein
MWDGYGCLEWGPLCLQAGTFFHDPLRPMMNSKQLREYVVLDIEACGPSTNRLALADVQVLHLSLLNV